ncbi:MAG: hypothetical protein DRH24_01785 [Deltaproteobacteria bacterium]|nr:MAG: hypothetical protein DRH24_01785 [Deltaproteobacteria bacterium]
MNKKIEFIERREYERFNIKNGAIAMIKLLLGKPEQMKDTSPGENILANKLKYCQIINISKGGLAFRYIDKNGDLNEPIKLDVLFSKDGICLTYLKNVPCRTRWVSHAPSKTSPSQVKIHQRGVQFGEMTSNQTAKLDHFLEKYTIGICYPKIKHWESLDLF